MFLKGFIFNEIPRAIYCKLWCVLNIVLQFIILTIYQAISKFQGSPQWIIVEFDKEETISELQIRFQGGFAGRDCWIESIDTDEKIHEFYPDDVNSLQISFLENLAG